MDIPYPLRISMCTEMELSSYWQKISSMVAQEVVILTTSCAASDDNFCQNDNITFSLRVYATDKCRRNVAP